MERSVSATPTPGRAIGPDDREAELHRVQDLLSGLSDEQLLAVASETSRPGAWSASGSATVGGATVFLKRVPLTDVEAANPYSTRNHFGLPMHYSYGMGSAGFGVWRELALHQATSDHLGFPMLLHHRVMPRTTPLLGPLPWSDEEYVRYWNGSTAVGRFMEARRCATQEMWIALEHVPDVMFMWLVMNQQMVDEVLGQLFESIAILRSLGVVHFDAHLGNVVTDGRQCRLTDFGLGLGSTFDLGARERKFLDRHRHYDYGVVLGSLGRMLAMALGRRSAEAVGDGIDHLEELPMAYHPRLIEAFRRYRSPILYMVDFFEKMGRPSKRATYDDDVLAQLLREARVPIS
jgi:hypothetical protein